MTFGIDDNYLFEKIVWIYYCRLILLVLLLFVFSHVDRVALDTLAALLKSSKFLNTGNTRYYFPSILSTVLNWKCRFSL